VRGKVGGGRGSVRAVWISAKIASGAPRMASDIARIGK
jgi:hypothetical protein